MEFWGVEVQAGKPIKVTPEEDTLVHISHASLGDCKGKKGETVTLNVNVGGRKFVLGTLLSESIPQTVFDVIFDKESELSHNWGKGSVYFVGYKCPNNKDDEGGEYFSDSEEDVEEEVPASVTAIGNAAKAVAKPKPATAQAKKNVEPETDDFDSEGMDVDEDDSDDEDDSEEEEETPMKAESRKKRAHEAAPKTSVSAKKAKAEVTPKKTEEKKKGGPATSHPAKKGGKTPTTATQSPKSASQVSCGPCKKTFNSANALESHSKAKHSATAK